MRDALTTRRNFPGLFAGLAAAILLAVVLAGCGRQLTGATLQGTVSIDGEPVESGVIQFIPTGETDGQAVSSAIDEGRYRVEGAALGEVTVRIRARESDGTYYEDAGEQLPNYVEVPLPEEYRDGFPLQVTGDDPELNFDL